MLMLLIQVCAFGDEYFDADIINADDISIADDISVYIINADDILVPFRC